MSHGILDNAIGPDPKADEEVPLLKRREATQPSIEALVTSLDDEDARERWEAAAALGDLTIAPAGEALVSALSDPHPFVRWQAGQALGHIVSRLRKKSSTPFLRVLRPDVELSSLAERVALQAHSPNVRTRAAAADALGEMGLASGLVVLRGLLSDEASDVRASAALAIGRLCSDKATGDLQRLLEDGDRWVRRAATEALGRIGGSAAERALVAQLQNAEPMLRASAASALGHCTTSSAAKALIDALSDESGLVRWQAARALGAVGRITAVPHLEQLAGDSTLAFGVAVQDVAAEAVRSIKRRHRGLWNTLRRWISSLRVDKRAQV